MQGPPVPSDSPRIRKRLRCASWVLALSLLPMLTFVGHWTLDFPVPGTSVRIAVPLPPPQDLHAHSADTDGHHQDHCHSDVASCSDLPLTQLASVALLHDALAFLAADARLELLPGHSWQPAHVETVVPEPAPPRSPAC
ncbi:MAG: hypothetical protein M0R74_04170 [Dehalococcoidia bacterium]|nr:hypothetical protein [Dehalococcoidia bacterium]